MRVVIQKDLNVPTQELGLIYSVPIIESAIAKINGVQISGMIGMPDTTSFVSMVDLDDDINAITLSPEMELIVNESLRIKNPSHFFTNLTIEDTALVGDLIILDNEEGLSLSKIINNVDFKLCVIGSVLKNGYFYTAHIHSINATIR